MTLAIDTLAYARQLRQAGFSEAQAEGQAQPLAAAMTDSLATKSDLQQMDARIEVRFTRIDARFDALEDRIALRLVELEKRLEIRLAEQERRVEIRFSEQAFRFNGALADLERRITVRLGAIMIGSVGALSALRLL